MRVTDENGSPPDEGQVPERLVTVNQIVAWNIAWYRRAASLTQSQLAEAVGWKKSALSDAERSVKGGFTREFDAQEIFTFAAALEIPVAAFYLPPTDDGEEADYYTEIPGEDGCPVEVGMAGLLSLVLPNSGSDSPAMGAYRDRLRSQTRRYSDPYWYDQIVALLDENALPEMGEDIEAFLLHLRDDAGGLSIHLGLLAEAAKRRKS